MIEFWSKESLKIIRENVYYNIWYLFEENLHICSCIYCDYEEKQYWCSLCGFKSEDINDFKNWELYKCKKCQSNLITQYELNRMVLNKKALFNK